MASDRRERPVEFLANLLVDGGARRRLAVEDEDAADEDIPVAGRQTQVAVTNVLRRRVVGVCRRRVQSGTTEGLGGDVAAGTQGRGGRPVAGDGSSHQRQDRPVGICRRVGVHPHPHGFPQVAVHVADPARRVDVVLELEQL
ncbi:MAG: hypothetical protein ACXVHB_19565 [Solirubrobacteraceae bacterium]